jgi:nucleoside phosphorylase
VSLIDYLVLTPLDEEWDVAAAILFPPSTAERTIGSTTYYLGRPAIDAPGSKEEYLIVGAPMSHRTPGQAYAASMTTRALQTWRPARVVLLGIAGSLERERLILGDVVVSESIWGYEVGDAEGKRFIFRKTFNQVGAEDFDRVRAFKRSKPDYAKWQRAGRANAAKLNLDIPRPPQLHLETTASGNFVVKSVAFGRQLRKEIDAKICAVEMEARGLHQALYLDAHRTDALMIRGISDYADRRKSALEKSSKNAWRAYAVGNAARLLRAIWQRRPHDPLSSRTLGLDLTTGSLLDLRRRRNPPVPSIEFKKAGAQDLVFPRLLSRAQPTPELRLGIRATLKDGGVADGYRGQCLVHAADFRIIPGDLSNGTMSFRLPPSEGHLAVELQLSFPTTVREVELDCVDDFGRAASKTWTNPVTYEER